MHHRVASSRLETFRHVSSSSSRLSLDTDPLLLRELPIGFGDGTGTQARPPLTPGNSAGLSVRNRTGEQATPPVVTAHRSSPAPSAPWCMSSPGGRETRAGTTRHRLDGPRGLAAHTRAPRSRGGYRLAGDPTPSASCSGRAWVDASPAHLAWGFLERVVKAPPPSNSGLPAEKGRGANTSSGSAGAVSAVGWKEKEGRWGRRGRADPPPLPVRGGMRRVRMYELS